MHTGVVLWYHIIEKKPFDVYILRYRKGLVLISIKNSLNSMQWLICQFEMSMASMSIANFILNLQRVNNLSEHI